ncbi:MAG: heavy-metal-associated domain-containing protein [Synechococcaceae cyanobacterium RL_1_2]|nr:heavy-metal-associated domain-containing protein [Synechococcaceae cyanobacterium RL_1_2]
MTITLKVSSIACSACGDAITKAIATHDPTAKVRINVEEKLVAIDGQTDEATLKKVIIDIGHTPD